MAVMQTWRNALAVPRGTHRRVVIACVFIGMVAPVVAAQDVRADTHVRGLDESARRLIAEARLASRTVSLLIDRLDRSDVIVLTTVGFMSDGVEADTRFITVTKRVRILSLRIDRLAAPWDRMAYLGHELQHAVEVAEAAEVRSDADLRALMTRIGRKRDEGRRFETDGAVRAALNVRREIGVTPTR